MKPRTERRRVEDETKRFGKEYQGYVYIRRDDYAGKAVKVEDLSKPLGTRSMSSEGNEEYIVFGVGITQTRD